MRLNKPRGYEPLKLDKPGKRMWHAIILAYGGGAKLARVIGESPQNIMNWRARGFVTPKKAGDIARKLNLPPYLLNYGTLQSLYPDATPSWEEAVNQTPFSEEMKRWILNVGKEWV